MGRLTIQSPADYSDCLACAGGRAYARKGSIWMRQRGESFSIFDEGELLGVAYLVTAEDGRREFCLSIRHEARSRMRGLCRLAHSTLQLFADHGVVVFCRVMPGNRSGVRMARLVGFRPSGEDWIFEGENDDAGSQGAIRRRRRHSEEGSSEEPGAAADCQ